MPTLHEFPGVPVNVFLIREVEEFSKGCYGVDRDVLSGNLLRILSRDHCQT
jgi:hypothetical protein